MQAATKAAQMFARTVRVWNRFSSLNTDKKQVSLAVEWKKNRHGCQSYSALSKLLLKQKKGSLEHCGDEIRLMGFHTNEKKMKRKRKRERKKKKAKEKEEEARFIEYGMEKEPARLHKLVQSYNFSCKLLLKQNKAEFRVMIKLIGSGFLDL